MALSMATRIRQPRSLHLGLSLGVALVFAVATARAASWRLVVHQAKPGVSEAPVLVEVNPSLPVGDYVVDFSATKEPVAAQVFGEADKRWLGCVLPAMAAEGTYNMRPQSSQVQHMSEGFKLIPRGSNIAIQIDGRPFSEYRTDVGAKPFLFPLVGPTGRSYTRAYPMETMSDEDHDHPHQRSFWLTHGKLNGVDFWSEQGEHGTIKETGRTCTVAGPVLSRLCTSDDWIGTEGTKVCEDERTLTFFRTPTARVIDFEVAIKASAGPVTFGDTKEGMFGLRVASSMDVDRKRGGRIINAEGLTDGLAWGKASCWVDYSGPVDGKIVGIAILNHPRSFRYPTTWHVRTYGLFAANPFGWHDFGLSKSGDYTLPKGETLGFAYRVILHEGDASSARVADAFASYESPPGIEVKGQ